MTTTISRTNTLGFDAVVLENVIMRVVLLPSLGGRIWELTDKAHDRQWIWHREGVRLGPSSADAEYDDVWAGGWEQLFPNDAKGEFEGRALPDHGEWWRASWGMETKETATGATIRLTSKSNFRPVTCSKEIQLDHDSSALRVTYRMMSQDTEPFHFLFKEHLPVRVDPSCRLVVPGGRVMAVDPQFGNVLSSPGPASWPGFADPTVAGVADLQGIPAASFRRQEFVYLDQLSAGWCGVDDRRSEATLRMHFDLQAMPYLWFFLSYGGWRDCYTAVLEPCTNLPKDLGEAKRRGQSARLTPGGVFETTVTVTLGSLSDSSG